MSEIKKSVRTIVIASQNKKKLKEMLELVGESAHVKTLADIGLGDLDVAETADTFSGNAQLKVEGVWQALHERNLLPELAAQNVEIWAVLADDSGLCVPVLGEAPGIYSARYAVRAHKIDAAAPKEDIDHANNLHLQAELADTLGDQVADMQKRRAFYICVAVAQTKEGVYVEARGKVFGVIAQEPRGVGGFGYDPYFIPDEMQGLHMAELTPEQKHAISHRGKAMRALWQGLSGCG